MPKANGTTATAGAEVPPTGVADETAAPPTPTEVGDVTVVAEAPAPAAAPAQVKPGDTVHYVQHNRKVRPAIVVELAPDGIATLRMLTNGHVWKGVRNDPGRAPETWHLRV